MAEQHAVLSASGASRWIACPGSARLETQFPDSTSEFAKEGTLAHNISELKLTKYFKAMSTRTYNAKVKKLEDYDTYYCKEMEDATDIYVDHIKELALSFDSTPYVAIESKVSFEPYVPEAFGTADCVMIHGDTLYVRDLKYGKGVEVSAEGNAQLKLYALGAYLESCDFYDIRNVNMGIVQPRMNNINHVNLLVEDLLEWAESIKEVAKKAFGGVEEYKAGSHCRFCRAKAVCMIRGEANLELEKDMLKGPIYTNTEIGDILKRAEDLKKWAEDLKDYALSACLKGEQIPGYKAVNGKSARIFTDNDLAIDTLTANGVDETILFERKQLTLAQIEKAVGKKTFYELLGDFIEVKEGKPTLVTENDKREAISNIRSASDDFDNLDEQI